MKQAFPIRIVIACKQRLHFLVRPLNRSLQRSCAFLWAGLLVSGGALAASCSGPPVQSEAKLMQRLAGTWHLDKLAVTHLPLLTPIRQQSPTGVLTQTHLPAAKPSRPRLTSVDLIFRPDGQVYALPAGASPVAMNYEIDATQDPPQLILYTYDRGIYNAEFRLVGDNELQLNGGSPRPFLRQPVSLQRQSYATEPPVAAVAPAPDWEDPDEQARRWRRRSGSRLRPIGRPASATADPTLARADFNRLLQAQVAYFQIHQRFADRLVDLPHTSTLPFDQYRYQILPTDTSQQVILTAQARQSNLPSFSGIVSFAHASSPVNRTNPMPNTLLCSTIEPSALPPSLIVETPKQMSCPIGSTQR
jgi:hypothetical protein